MSEFRLAEHLCSGPFATFDCLLKQFETRRHGASRRQLQISDSHQIVSRSCELEDPTDQLQATVSCLPQERHGLQPAKDLFHAFALPLTNSITRMAGGALIDRTGAAPL